ncbi:hypothetical protein WJX81_008359 [Elliptochloris bilobata]|uniref:Zinc finger C2H2 LYAR-type domain-containing protein n=1 Tax=Elliptochloris bilobata TaxID=381761 RepID=A0AAW1S6V3_9CHLO
MVWFQCDDCGDSLKKPKVQGHLNSCSASGFSCLDCSRHFDRGSVQGHTSCVTEHQKYALGATKAGGFASQGFYGGGGLPAPAATAAAPEAAAFGLEFLAARPPWRCACCGVTCTSYDTLMGHAAGVKHKRRARAAGKAQQAEAGGGAAAAPDATGRAPTASDASGGAAAAVGQTEGAERVAADTPALAYGAAEEGPAAKKRRKGDAEESGLAGSKVDRNVAAKKKATKKKRISAGLADGALAAGEDHGASVQPSNARDLKAASRGRAATVDAAAAADAQRKSIKWKKLAAEALRANKGKFQMKTGKLLAHLAAAAGVPEAERDARGGEALRRLQSSSQFRFSKNMRVFGDKAVAMGGMLSTRVGSDPYYTSLESRFERLQADSARINESLQERRRREAAVKSAIVFYGIAGFAAALAFAAWVVRQPPGTYTARGHSTRVAPLFLEPFVAWLAHALAGTALQVAAQRDAARLARLQGNLRKMVAGLKDSTHYERTQRLLERFDPDYQPPTPRRPPGGLGGLGGRLGDMLPALDRLATSLVGDNPALTEGFTAARHEAEALRAQLLAAQARARDLAAENAALRERLGLGPQPQGPQDLDLDPIPGMGRPASV